MDYFSFPKHHLPFLTCPQCITANDHSTLSFTVWSGRIYFTCTRCNAFYPFKRVPYISGICSPSNCSHECMRACGAGAIVQPEKGYFSIRYEQCRFCNQCVSACPLKAVVCFLTPFFSMREPFSSNGEIVTTPTSEDGITFYYLSSLQTVLFSTEVLLYHVHAADDGGIGEDCYRRLKETLPAKGIVFDARCADNSFKALYGEAMGVLDVLGADVTLTGSEERRRYYCPVEFFYDERALPLVSRRFNFILVNYVLNCLSEPRIFLAEMNRILKKGGQLFISVWRTGEERFWRKLFINLGFQVLERKIMGNIFSLFHKRTVIKRSVFSCISSNRVLLYVLAKHQEAPDLL